MTTVAIVYFSATGNTNSATGNTKLMAEAIEEDAASVTETTTKVFRITGEQITAGRWQDETVMAELNQAEAIVIGSPTYMGGVAAQIKTFIDAAGAVWQSQGWKDKILGRIHSLRLPQWR